MTVTTVFFERELSFLRTIENWSADLRQSVFTQPVPQNQDIVILAITEDSLAKMPYRSPIDREFLARLLIKLDQAAPRAIGIDIIFVC